MEKTCKLPEKNKIDPKCSKFLGICVVAELFSALILQGSLGQNVEGIGPLSPFLCLGQPPLEHLHLRLAHMHPRPIMVLHVSQQFLILVGLSQQPLQVSIELDKHGLSLSGQWITGSSSIQVAVTTDPPQLIKSLLILQLFVALL